MNADVSLKIAASSGWFIMKFILLLGLVLLTAVTARASDFKPASDSVGQPVDIASSAYQYRSDRRADANPPESWLGLMRYAGQPLDRPLDRQSPAIRQALCALLWEEIRPVQTLELNWPANAKRIPSPERLHLTALVAASPSSSWWNNLRPVAFNDKPTISNGGRTLRFTVARDTCGLVVHLDGDAQAYDVPRVRAYTADTWKQQEIEVEWGFDRNTLHSDYSGHVETYDGRIQSIHPITASTILTGTNGWRSSGATTTTLSGGRRGIRLHLLYQGISKWRKQQEYTTQPDDVARTIVTIWTRAGNFSFLAADLENGPILAPEFGFFVRRVSAQSTPGAGAVRRSPPVVPELLTARMDSIAQTALLKGWGSNDTPWFGSNPSDQPVSTLGITMPAHSVAMHPGEFVDVAAVWKSPVRARVTLQGSLAHAQGGGNGIEWWVAYESALRPGRRILDHGTTDGSGGHALGKMAPISVEPGDRILLIIGPKGDYHGDTTLLDWTIAEARDSLRRWNLAGDVSADPMRSNPHPDSNGNPEVWSFCSEKPMEGYSSAPSDPPIRLASDAPNARAFEKELAARGLKTIRQQVRQHAEQTWEGAVTAMRGTDLPPIPAVPEGSEPHMQVEVPSQRLTAQWRLGAWHLVRHCAIHPATGRLWFNDYPYGILAAETYLVLSVLDQMGSHQAAEDGFYQWVSLPLERNHPVGLFTDGNGALTNAVGPVGVGGQMDGVHAFGAGSIGWALTRHYQMTGDRDWLKAAAPRLIANAEWMLRQRQTVSSMVPGGERLWCKGLQPALQVTPDSGGLWMQFYECEAYYWASVSRLAAILVAVDPVAARRLSAEAEGYRRDLKAAVERSIALSPVMPVRDGTFHSVVPFACYVRGLSTGAWGFRREGSGSHVGPLYWDTVQTGAALISPAGLLSPRDVRVQGYLDVLEDRLLLENHNVGNRDWFDAGWQYQGGLERTANMHLAADDIPVFLRSFLNCYAVDILPHDGYVFNEHAVHGPPDKIFEEAAFLERFRNLLVMEEGTDLWIARGTPRDWFRQGQHISVKHAPSAFGELSYTIRSEVSKGHVDATIELPNRNPAARVLLRIRHPESRKIRSVRVNGAPWKRFDSASDVVILQGISGTAHIEVRY